MRTDDLALAEQLFHWLFGRYFDPTFPEMLIETFPTLQKLAYLLEENGIDHEKIEKYHDEWSNQ